MIRLVFALFFPALAFLSVTLVLICVMNCLDSQVNLFVNSALVANPRYVIRVLFNFI